MEKNQDLMVKTGGLVIVCFLIAIALVILLEDSSFNFLRKSECYTKEKAYNITYSNQKLSFCVVSFYKDKEGGGMEENLVGLFPFLKECVIVEHMCKERVETCFWEIHKNGITGINNCWMPEWVGGCTCFANQKQEEFKPEDANIDNVLKLDNIRDRGMPLF